MMCRLAILCIELACVLTASKVIANRCTGVVLHKSITQAQEECVEYLRIPRARLTVYKEHIYPQDAETKCMVRCMGINLGWWNDTEGVKETTIRAYFHPDPDDCQYDRRTYHCLKSQRLDSHALQAHDPCERAYESFRCYYEQYGNIVVTPQFVPLSELRMDAVTQDCANMLQLLPTDCGGSEASSAITVRDVGCLYRCVLLRSGLYSEHYGPNLDRVYVQGEGYHNETLFREITSTCFRKLKSECLDECDLAFRFVHECFPDGGITLTVGVSVGNILGSVISNLIGSLVPELPGIVPTLPSLPIPLPLL